MRPTHNDNEPDNSNLMPPVHASHRSSRSRNNTSQPLMATGSRTNIRLDPGASRVGQLEQLRGHISRGIFGVPSSNNTSTGNHQIDLENQTVRSSRSSRPVPMPIPMPMPMPMPMPTPLGSQRRPSRDLTPTLSPSSPYLASTARSTSRTTSSRLPGQFPEAPIDVSKKKKAHPLAKSTTRSNLDRESDVPGIPLPSPPQRRWFGQSPDSSVETLAVTPYPPLHSGGSGNTGDFGYSTTTLNNSSPEASQYFPMSHWLQAPWLRLANQMPQLPSSFPGLPSMSMPMPVHFVFKPKKVQLTHGNLVLDTPVPGHYLSAVEYQDGQEFETMRYMAVTCDADQVPANKYELRAAAKQQQFGQIEMAICLTICDETPQQFCMTLHSLIKNIRSMCFVGSKSRAHKDPTWGAPESWRKIAICVVADGRRRIDPMIFKILAAMGCWQEGVAKNHVNGKEVQAHIFEYATQVSADSKLKLKGQTLKNSNKHKYPPIQLIFCLKERHTKKLNSHRWFFHALCPLLNPRITLLTAAGAKIGDGSLYQLWHAFHTNSHTAGACGEIRVAKGLLWWKVLNPIIAAQIFEYKVSSVLEKPFESIFGYISVMPGQLSAYRYEALLPEPISGKGPLTTYFEPDYLVLSEEHEDISEVLQFSYFAEDQLLPFLVTTRPSAAYTMQYVRSAWAEVELPSGIGSFLNKKRRWQNRRFSGLIYAISHARAIWKSGHSVFRKLWISLEMIYLGCDTVFWFLALGNYYVVFYYMTQTLTAATNGAIPDVVFMLTRYMYICLIVVVMMISMGNSPKGNSLYLFILSFVFFGCIQAYLLFAAGYLTYLHAIQFLPYAQWNSMSTVVAVFEAAGYHVLILALVACYGVYLLSALLYGEPWHMIACFVQFLLLMPSYVSVLGVYANCNMHEVSWGIKEEFDHEGDPMINRDAICHGSTVRLPDDKDVAASYQEALDDLDNRRYSTNSGQLRKGKMIKTKDEKKSQGDIKTRQSDYYRTFRTRLLLFWIVVNGLLVITIASEQLAPYLKLKDGSNLYVAIVVWTITVGAFGRFLGSFVYLIGWIVDKIRR